MEDKPDTYVWCGDIAAKNSHGAYGGFAPFALAKSGRFNLGGKNDKHGFNIILVRGLCGDAPNWAWGRN